MNNLGTKTACVGVALLVLGVAGLSDGKRCSSEEEKRLKDEHLKCTKTVEQRYSIITLQNKDQQGKSNGNLGAPFVYTSSSSLNGGVAKEHVCAMIEEVVQKCSRLFEQCLDAKELRGFKDNQLEVFIQVMGSLYNMEAVVSECESVQEYERSGRRGQVQPTTECSAEQVTSLTINYQQCIETANEVMTRDMHGNIKNLNKMFDALCTGMNQVVHECGDLLHACYSEDEIQETKIGQLELTKQVFNDMMGAEDGQSSFTRQQRTFNLAGCSAYNSLTSAGSSNKSPTYTSYIVMSSIISLFAFVLVAVAL